MTSRVDAGAPFDEYELSQTSTHTSDDTESAPFYYDADDTQLALLGDAQQPESAKSIIASRLASVTPAWLRRRPRRLRVQRKYHARRHCFCSPRSFFRNLALISYAFLASIIVIIIVGAIFFPSYTHLPPHYAELRRRALASEALGRVNLGNQKVYIAASLYDKGGKLAGGRWAENVLDLIRLIGPDNTFLSIYMNDSGPEAEEALAKLEQRVPCEHSLVFEEHLHFDEVPHITLPDGTSRIKRIAYLAEVRNRALIPLASSNTTYDKLLYLNDVVFDPIEAAQLIFSTNTGADGVADYRAACSVDFINPFKFYDTFATRDADGFSMGLPFFPWFSASGDERSHQDVLDGSDAVRVRSCWGGMVSFDARFFQKQPGALEPHTAGSYSPSKLHTPYLFRAEEDLYWDASECCLIHADIQGPDPRNPGIYMNPFVRVAYDTNTLSWLGFTRRFERLYTPIHFLLDILVSLPHYNERREEEPWQEVVEKVWIPDEASPSGGSFQEVARLASHSGFCGRRNLSVMKENIAEGERNWEHMPVPSGL